MKFHRTFCPSCKRITAHEYQDLTCLHKHDGSEDEVVAWEKEKDGFQKWLVGLDELQVMEVGRMVGVLLEYKSRKLDLREFNKMMEGFDKTS